MSNTVKRFEMLKATTRVSENILMKNDNYLVKSEFVTVPLFTEF